MTRLTASSLNSQIAVGTSCPSHLHIKHLNLSLYCLCESVAQYV